MAKGSGSNRTSSSRTGGALKTEASFINKWIVNVPTSRSLWEYEKRTKFVC